MNCEEDITNIYIDDDVNININVPSVIFIVPYRNRPQHKMFFLTYLKSILPETLNYEIYLSHQCDIRSFNRGATKNIGFIAMKNKYPDHYKNISFVFNDIDTVPFANLFDYETTEGIVKHFYGFKYALGGIVSILGSDMEKINGYPNFWGWGMEDNVLQKRCEQNGIIIDRSNFFPIGSPNILHLFDGVSRIINKKDPYRATHDNGIDGISSIKSLKYSIDTTSDNPNDNIHNIFADNIYFINIKNFLTQTRFEHDNYFNYDLREPPRQIIHPSKIKTKVVDHITDDWSNIPYYPTMKDKQKMINLYGEEKTDEIIQTNLNNSKKSSKVRFADTQQPQHTQKHRYTHQQHTHQQHTHQQQHKQQPQHTHQHTQQHTQQPQYTQQQQNLFDHALQKINSNNISKINKYSTEYSKYISQKPKATTSVNIRLGGAY